MIRRLGWLSDSLEYQIEKALRESIYANETYQDLSWTFFERLVVRCSSAPWLSVTLVALAWLVIVVGLTVLYDVLVNVAPPWNDPWSALIGWQQVILAGQLAMVGLIFPLVVGFVGILLQSRTAGRALWHIYNRYSGFMLSGLSGLLLAGLIVISQFVSPWTDLRIESAMSIGFTLWFLGNIVLAAWFLHATFQLVSIGRRNLLLLRFSVNEAFLQDIRRKLSSHIFPSQSMKFISEQEQAHFRFSRSRNNEVSVVERQFQSPMYLRNVHFRLLRKAFRRWASISAGDRDAVLSVPVRGYEYDSKHWVLAESRAIKLDRVTSLLIRLSYVFGARSRTVDNDVDIFVNALVGDVEDAIVARNVRLFEYGIDELRSWHNSISDALAFVNDNESQDNWLLLSEGSFFGRTYLDKLCHEYFVIGNSAVRLIPYSSRFFELFSHFYVLLFAGAAESVTSTGAKRLIDNHRFLWSSLVDWHSGIGVETTGTERNYESSVIAFVGSWEHWAIRLRLLVEQREEGFDALPVYLSHLTASAQLIIHAVRRENWEAAEWGADILVNWYESMFGLGDPHRYTWKTELITPSVMGQNTAGPIWLEILGGEQFDEADALQFAIRNAWFDIRIATAAYLEAKPEDGNNERVSLIARALLENVRLRPTGASQRTTSASVRRGGDLLGAYIRQSNRWERYEGNYAGWLDQFVESLGRIEEERHVSGRMYMGWGASDVRSLIDSYVRLAVSYSSSEWPLSGQLLSFIRSDAVSVETRNDIVRDLREWLTKAADGLPDDVEEDSEAATQVVYLTNSVNRIIEFVLETNREQILNAVVDEDRLLAMGYAASGLAFVQDSPRAPIHFFNRLASREEMSDETRRSIPIANFQKSQIAEGIEDSLPVNEGEAFADLVSQHVDVRIYSEIYNSLGFIEKEFEEINSLLVSVIQDANTMAAMGLTPVFLAYKFDVYQLLDELVWGELANDFGVEINRYDGNPNDYVCHLGRIEVFHPSASADGCVLVAKEMFTMVEYRDISDGRYVEVSFLPDEDDPAVGTLELAYWMNVDLGNQVAYKYFHTGQSDED